MQVIFYISLKKYEACAKECLSAGIAPFVIIITDGRMF